MRVTPMSAAPTRNSSYDEELSIKRGHSDMVKFSGSHDSEWTSVAFRLASLVEDVWTDLQGAITHGK